MFSIFSLLLEKWSNIICINWKSAIKNIIGFMRFLVSLCSYYSFQ